MRRKAPHDLQKPSPPADDNGKGDKFEVQHFHHLEFYALDASSTARRLQAGLGMTWTARSDLSTGNSVCVSHVIRSNDVVLVVTSPQPAHVVQAGSACPLPGYDNEMAFHFVEKHGLAVRAIGIKVSSAEEAWRVSTACGGISVLPPTTLTDADSCAICCIAEVAAYGDVVLRFVSGAFGGPFLPGYAVVNAQKHCFGLQRMDHCVANVPEISKVADYLRNITGFHEFAKFAAEEIGTATSGLNSVVLANDSDFVLLPVNEPSHGSKGKSHVQTFLEYNGGPGVQHLAVKTDDIFETLRQMRAVSHAGGFEFMARPPDEYYRRMPERIGDALTAQQYREAEEFGILVDRDNEGLLLQIFTQPISDRPTFIFEIIQRVGCMYDEEVALEDGTVAVVTRQAGGCGGFGKGNFSELYKSIERQLAKDLPQEQACAECATGAEP